MNNLLSYFIEANLYLACIYLLYQLLLVRDKHFRFNRAFLLGGIMLSMSLPLLSFDITSPNTMEGYIVLPVITINEVQTESVGFILKWWHIIGIVYFGGTLFYFSRLIWQITQILRHLPLLNSSREKKDGYTLVTTNGEIPTCSFFRYLFWDRSANLTTAEREQVFAHELAHIRQWHSIDILFIELLRAIFWINPVIHLIKSRIAEVHEYLADFSATRKVGIERYSALLTAQIFKSFDFSLSNNFHKSQVVKRIRMLKSTKSKSLWLNVAMLVPTLAFLIAIFSCNVNELTDINNSSQLMPINDITVNNESSLRSNDTKEIFTKVENQPAPVGGMGQFYKYVQSTLKYPEAAKKTGIEGKVFVQFIVGSDGKLKNVQAVKGIGGGCDEEAVRVVGKSQPWQPGTNQGEKVDVRMILPITFKLG